MKHSDKELKTYSRLLQGYLSHFIFNLSVDELMEKCVQNFKKLFNENETNTLAYYVNLCFLS